MKQQQYSNANAGETSPHPVASDLAIVPIRSVGRRRNLPPLILQRIDWENIGRKMGWLVEVRPLESKM